MVGLGDAKKYLKDENQHVPLKHTNNYSNIENNFSSANTHYGTSKETWSWAIVLIKRGSC